MHDSRSAREDLHDRATAGVALALDYVALKFTRNEQLKSRQFFAETPQDHQQFA
jgi:hypothetical protein